MTPRLTLILITYNQSSTVESALQGALDQDHGNLEILVSDDASTDDTYSRISAMAARYQGPHTLHVWRNECNLGIGANLSAAAQRATGELLVVAAGDDVSVPHRCSVLARSWVDKQCKPDLLASYLVDMDAQGNLHGVIKPSSLETLQSPDDWLDHRPHVVGAAQAWSKRLFDRFGPLPPGVVAEDLVMVFRAVATGGALTIPEPLVHYRRGGLSGRKNKQTPSAVIAAWLKASRHAEIEAALLLKDSQALGCSPRVTHFWRNELAMARYTNTLFAQIGRFSRLKFALTGPGMPLSRRIRLMVYAVAPELLWPFFQIKAVIKGERQD